MRLRNRRNNSEKMQGKFYHHALLEKVDLTSVFDKIDVNINSVA